MVSFFDLAAVMGQEVSGDQRRQIAQGHPAPDASMLSIKQVADRAGIPLVGVAAPLDKLQRAHGPKILHLISPEHFLVMVRASSDALQLLDRGRVAVVTRKEIERRYSGHALILKQQERTPGPILELEDFHYSFGIAGVGQVVEHAFKLSNAGDEDLVVSLQAKGCGAPSASIGKETLAPGESADVTVQFTVSYSGNVTKSVKLLTNDLTQPVAFVTVHGNVPHDLRVDPDRILLTATKGEVLTRTVTVIGPAETDLEQVSCERGLFEVDVGEPQVSEEGKKTWQLKLSAKLGDFVGEIQGQLSIHTTHAERPLITIPITGRIRGDLEVITPAAFFGFVKRQEKAEQEIIICSRTGAAFAISNAEASEDTIRVAAPQRRDATWVVPISVDTSRSGVIDATVTLTTNVPGEETLTVGVYAHVIEDE